MGEWVQLGLAIGQRTHHAPTKRAGKKKPPKPRVKRGPKPASRDLLESVQFEDPLDDPMPF